MLRPGYLPPSRYDVGGKLLDKVQSSLMDTCRLTLENKTVSLSLDGWSNVHNEPIVSVSVKTDKGDSFLTDTIDKSGYTHIDYLTQLAENSIMPCEEKFKCRVGSVVTDNAANMAKMRRHLEENISRDLLTYGCSANLLNLLAKDVEIPEVKEQVIRIIKYFKIPIYQLQDTRLLEVKILLFHMRCDGILLLTVWRAILRIGRYLLRNF